MHKLEPRSVECVFLGYSVTQSAYKSLELTTNRIYVSRNVWFVPHIFPFATRQVLLVPRQLATSLPTMPQKPNVSLPTMPDDVIVTPVLLTDPSQQYVSPDLPQ
ncbi:hypothetical protein V6N11_079698 [Hibiscus sabdariffa]|uniref:Retroviral polymerase SH3-like domain-containing protein n=1 Tax=Hibiscus sabdariffa TaxID=183260 RepID=A0ABR2RW53_9ROSI